MILRRSATCAALWEVRAHEPQSALANTFASDTSGAAFAKMIVATVHPLDAIVTRNIRAEALDILMRNGIAVYSADKGAVMDLADSARAGELPLAASTHGSSS